MDNNTKEDIEQEMIKVIEEGIMKEAIEYFRGEITSHMPGYSIRKERIVKFLKQVDKK